MPKQNAGIGPVISEQVHKLHPEWCSALIESEGGHSRNPGMPNVQVNLRLPVMLEYSWKFPSSGRASTMKEKKLRSEGFCITYQARCKKPTSTSIANTLCDYKFAQRVNAL